MMKIETLSSSSIRASQTGDSICDPCSFDTSQFDGSISSKLDSGYGSGMVSDLEQLSVSEDPSSTGPDVPNPEASAPSATTILADNQESPSTQDTSFQHSSQSTSTTSTGNEVVSQQGALRESSPVPIRIGIAEFQNLSQFEDDGSYTARFDEITHAIERPLFHSLVPKNRLRLRKTSAQGSVVIRGFILGHTFEDRKPYMVFICNATQKPKIDNFLSRQQQVFQPQGLPHLAVEIMVVCVPKPLKLHAAVAGVTVEMSEFETFEDIDLSNTTLCGTPIRLYNTTSGHDRNATLGGVLKIIDKDNNVMFYGMTAGHLISDWIAPDVEEDNVSLRSESVSSGEEVEEASVVTPTDISDTEADASCGTDETSTLNSPNASKRSELTRLWAFRKFKTLGGLYTTTSSTNLDWAVYVLDHWKLNALVQADKIAHDLIELPVKPHEKTRQSVTILTASSGLIKGILQCGYAKLAVNPGDHPVNVIIISLDKGHTIADGDSGSWVVDDSSNTLIGHVVGTDFLGDVYVVPILDTLNDIRNNLNALLVTFPTPEDFIDFADDQSDAGSESTRENWQSVRSYLASTGVHDENLPVEGERKQLTTATGTSTERPSALSTDSRPISINSTARTTVTIESVAKYGSDWKMFSFASSRRRPVQMCVQTVKDFIQFVNETSLQFIGEDGAGEQRHYITQSALERYWTIDRVQDILTAFRLHLSAENVQRDYMRILSILTVCNKTEYLTEFTKLDLLDNAIPLKEAPRAWPVAFTNLYDDFYSHQWKFCPFQINPLSMHTKHLSKEYTLPPGQIETLNSNGDYDLIKVTLDHNCIKSKEIDDKNQRVYIFKMFKETTVAHFLAEEEAYKHVSERGLQPESLIKYYGSFVHDGRPGILLEHQEHISLDDFLSNTEPPTSSSDIMQFWASVSNLVSTLYMLHSSLQPSESPFDDIHGNISPDNIFIFRSSTTPYNFRFKILDFGTSTSRRLNRQTRYSPPTLDYTGPLSANDDIWSLGCLFSEISVWLVLGQKGLMAYSDMRSAEIALESEGANALSPAHSAAFHNGRQRLRCVSRMHEAALQHLKAPGSITKKVTNLVEIYMLKVRPTRLGARDVNRMVQKILAEAKAEIISEQSTDNRKGQMNSFFIASDSDVVAGSVDNNRNMAAKTTTQEMNFNGAESVSENLYRQMNPGDIINTRKAGQSSLDRPASRSLTLGRPLTLAEVMNYRRAKKQQTPADSWVASTVSNITNSLKGRDFMFIVDDSSSMSKHKGEVLDMIEALSWLLKQTDPDGIELSISSSANPYHARTTSSLMAFLENTSTWSQKTQADYILDTVSKRVETYWKSIGRRLIRRRPKPLNIFVLTDGMWETSTSNTVVAEAGYMRLEEVARCLMAANLPRTFYSIQFIRFGNDRSGASYLKHLDDIGRDFRFEIVDTKASTDDVWSILCGSLSESVDHAEES